MVPESETLLDPKNHKNIISTKGSNRARMKNAIRRFFKHLFKKEEPKWLSKKVLCEEECPSFLKDKRTQRRFYKTIFRSFVDPITCELPKYTALKEQMDTQLPYTYPDYFAEHSEASSIQMEEEDAVLIQDSEFGSFVESTFLVTPEQLVSNKPALCMAVGSLSPYHQFMLLLKLTQSLNGTIMPSAINAALSSIAQAKPYDLKIITTSSPIQKRQVEPTSPLKIIEVLASPLASMPESPVIMAPPLSPFKTGKQSIVGNRIKDTLERLKQCADSKQKAPVDKQLEKARFNRIAFHLSRQLGLRCGKP